MKLKDSKLGQFIKDKAPHLLEFVGDVLPDKGALGILKNVINRDPNVPPEVKAELETKWPEIELELHTLDQTDRANARDREVNFIKHLGHADWMQVSVGIMIMISFFAAIVIIGFKAIPSGNEHIMINAIGIMEGLVMSVASYYFGSSLGSRIKDMKAK